MCKRLKLKHIIPRLEQISEASPTPTEVYIKIDVGAFILFIEKGEYIKTKKYFIGRCKECDYIAVEDRLFDCKTGWCESCFKS